MNLTTRIHQSRAAVALALITAALAAPLTGCSRNNADDAAPHAVTAASPAQQAALLDRVKTLEGEWTMTDDQGVTHTASIFKVSSGGSVVREIMFPGHAHEMTNLYHMDGPTLVVTHYCAVGNQPRMRATADAANPTDIAFLFDDVTNWTGPGQTYMGQMTLEFKDSDHIVQRWWHFKVGAKGAPTVFELTRKR